MYFLVFHGKERFGLPEHGGQKAEDRKSSRTGHTDAHHAHDDEHASHDEHHHGLAPGQKPHESPWVVTLPLILLAIPSVGIGYVLFDPMLFGNYFRDAIVVVQSHLLAAVMHHEAIEEPFSMALHAFSTLPFWLAMAGVASAALFYLKRPDIPAAIKKRFRFIYTLLDNKYYFDGFNDWFFAGGARGVSGFLWKFGDVKLIDGMMVNGTARWSGCSQQ